MSGKRKYNDGPPENLKLCERCRLPFWPKNMRRLYCSVRCMAKAHHVAVWVSHARLNRGQSRPRGGGK